ncbi:MAG: hypothetical protein IH987_18230 [Planctomycetes bacterium]|nr:hypothetical protein [Planctomycetota bacterium]
MPKETTSHIVRGAKTTRVPASTVKVVDGAVKLTVRLELPAGWKINPRAPMGYSLSTINKEGPLDRAAMEKKIRLEEPAAEFEISVPAAAAEGKDTLRVALTYYFCQESAEGLCKVGSAIWIIPLTLSANGKKTQIDLQHKVE